MEIQEPFPAIQPSAGSTARSEAERRPTSVESAPGGKFFISPFLKFDSRALTIIFQVRDTESGDVKRQFPPETVVERYRQDPSSKLFTVPSGAAEDQQEEPEIEPNGETEVVTGIPAPGEEQASSAAPADDTEGGATQVNLVA